MYDGLVSTLGLLELLLDVVVLVDDRPGRTVGHVIGGVVCAARRAQPDFDRRAGRIARRRAHRHDARSAVDERFFRQAAGSPATCRAAAYAPFSLPAIRSLEIAPHRVLRDTAERRRRRARNRRQRPSATTVGTGRGVAGRGVIDDRRRRERRRLARQRRGGRRRVRRPRLRCVVAAARGVAVGFAVAVGRGVGEGDATSCAASVTRSGARPPSRARPVRGWPRHRRHRRQAVQRRRRRRRSARFLVLHRGEKRADSESGDDDADAQRDRRQPARGRRGRTTRRQRAATTARRIGHRSRGSAPTGRRPRRCGKERVGMLRVAVPIDVSAVSSTASAAFALATPLRVARLVDGGGRRSARSARAARQARARGPLDARRSGFGHVRGRDRRARLRRSRRRRGVLGYGDAALLLSARCARRERAPTKDTHLPPSIGGLLVFGLTGWAANALFYSVLAAGVFAHLRSGGVRDPGCVDDDAARVSSSSTCCSIRSCSRDAFVIAAVALGVASRSLGSTLRRAPSPTARPNDGCPSSRCTFLVAVARRADLRVQRPQSPRPSRTRSCTSPRRSSGFCWGILGLTAPFVALAQSRGRAHGA